MLTRPSTRHNHLNVHGIIRFTAVLPGWDRSRPIRSATASRPSAVKGHRPAAMTTNGSTGAASVQAAGSENNSPSSSLQ